jgi:hypothetical protein
MIHEVQCDSHFALLRGPSLVAWLVENTEQLVLVAAALDAKAEDLAPGVPVERVIELCKTVRHSALETTVALLALLSRAERGESGALAEAIANAHVRIQELASASNVASASADFCAAQADEGKASQVAAVSRR